MCAGLVGPETAKETPRARLAARPRVKFAPGGLPAASYWRCKFVSRMMKVFAKGAKLREGIRWSPEPWHEAGGVEPDSLRLDDLGPDDGETP